MNRLVIFSVSQNFLPFKRSPNVLVSTRTMSQKSDFANEEAYAMSVNPVDTKYLQSQMVKIRSNVGKNIIPIWNVIQAFKSKASYVEKTFLIDPKVSQTICDAIEKYSQRGPDTKFIDADGGLCLVTKEVMKRDLFPSPKSYLIFETHPTYRSLHERAQNNFLSKPFKICKININSFVPECHKNWGYYLDPLSKEISAYPGREWEDIYPNYVLFGTVTHGFLKYLTGRCLHRSSGEFSFGRPEFFFILSGRTWTHISLSKSQHILAKNVLFSIVFDFELVAELPRESFLPWKNGSLGGSYRNEENKFYLVRVRPKKDLGLADGTPPHYLTYFVQSLYQHPQQRLIPLIEQWYPGVGLDYVLKGYSVYTTVKELDISEVIPAFNILLQQKNFDSVNNSFVIQANDHAKSMYKDNDLSSEQAKDCYVNLRRKLSLSVDEAPGGALGSKKKSQKKFPG